MIKYISIEDYNKIPKDKIKLFEVNSNKNYLFDYNPNLTLDEQITEKYINELKEKDAIERKKHKKQIDYFYHKSL